MDCVDYFFIFFSSSSENLIQLVILLQNHDLREFIHTVVIELALGNLLVAIAYFLSVTTSVSVFLKILGRKHEVPAFLISVPLVALSNFSTILVLYLAPPKPATRQLFTSAHDLVFYSAAAIVFAFCGLAVFRWFAEDAPKQSATSAEVNPKRTDGIAVLMIGALLLSIWGWLVFAGQTRLTQTLLPEITHPIEKQKSKSDT